MTKEYVRACAESRAAMWHDPDTPEFATKSRPPIDLLRDLFAYDPSTGLFTCNPRRPEHFNGTLLRPAEVSCHIWNAQRAGKAAFIHVDGAGYLDAEFMGYRVVGHRAAWAITYGEWPPMLDHKDRNRHNNRIDNLRVTSDFHNAQNREVEITGIKQMPSGRWRATIMGGFRRARKLGYFATKEEAIAAREREVAILYDAHGKLKPSPVVLRRKTVAG